MFRNSRQEEVATEGLAKWTGPYSKRLKNQHNTNGLGDPRIHHADCSLQYFILNVLKIDVHGILKDFNFYSSASY